MPPVRMKGDGRKAKNPKKTLSRLLLPLADTVKTEMRQEAAKAE